MRVVLDTNVVVSALLHGGPTRRFQGLWRSGSLQVLTSQAILDEYTRVLSYPKFGFSEEFVAELLGEALLPFLTRVDELNGSLAYPPSDKGDEPFLRAALGSGAEALVSGDPHLTILDGKYSFPILRPSIFLIRYFPKDGEDTYGVQEKSKGYSPKKRTRRNKKV
jgi:putative PIN family toxin of toxin-antitoxin system